MKKDWQDRSGFTLIELMVVVIIIAALAGMVLPRVLPMTDDAKSRMAAGDVANIGVGLKMFYLHNGRFPTTEEGVKALMAAPAGAKSWRGPYLEKKALDPWKQEYQYKQPGTHNPSGYDLWSTGAKPDDAADDIGNWE